MSFIINVKFLKLDDEFFNIQCIFYSFSEAACTKRQTRVYIINSISCTGTLHVFTDHVDDIIASLFQYLKMLRETGPKDWIFKEVQVCVFSCLYSLAVFIKSTAVLNITKERNRETTLQNIISVRGG